MDIWKLATAASIAQSEKLLGRLEPTSKLDRCLLKWILFTKHGLHHAVAPKPQPEEVEANTSFGSAGKRCNSYFFTTEKKRKHKLQKY